MFWKSEWKPLAVILAVFLFAYFLPVGTGRFDNAIFEALYLLKWYAQEHVILCLLPAFLIAGAIGVFISQDSVMRYLGAKANKALAYGVASVSGTVLAVCSCTVLPLFAGIYKRGAGLGPAIAFLYSGPAINVLAIILTARILGPELGIARAVGAISFSVIIGLIMHFLFKKEETERNETFADVPVPHATRPLWQTVVYFALMVGILVFSNWGKPQFDYGIWFSIFSAKWIISSVLSVLFALVLIFWFNIKWWKMAVSGMLVSIAAFIFPGNHNLPFAVGIVSLSFFTSLDKGETGEWFSSSWGFAKQITPLLLGGILVSGFLLGRPGNEGVIPSDWVAYAVGGNSLWANLFASIVGAFMYFATLTEVPILQGLIGSGMGKGPALALLLSGPALSLPSMLVIRSVLGTKKTVAYVLLVIIMSTITGLLYGAIFS
jgi:hypothetical protein